MIRVVVADDHRVVRVGLEQLLATFEDIEAVGFAAGGEEAVALCRELEPECCCWISRCRTWTASR